MSFFVFLKGVYPALTSEDYNMLAECFVSRTFRKGELIIKPGETQRELYFVESGAQMSYFETTATTHVVAFTYAPNICAVPGCLTLEKPSNCFITCLEDSEMKAVASIRLQELFQKQQRIETLFLRLTEAVLVGVIDRHIELQSLSMTDRYKNFCRRSPHLLQLVPHKYIASYLGIDRTNFSKLYNSVRI